MQNLLLALISIPILVVMRWMAIGIPYTNQGFFCDDDEIRYPNRPGTIDSDKMHLLYGIIVLLLVCIYYSLNNFMFLKIARAADLNTFGKQVPLSEISLAALHLQSIPLKGKVRYQRVILKTFFFYGSNSFVENFSCLGESRPDEHFSFPSSHASHSLYFATFVILYLHRRFRLPDILRAFIQFLVFILAVFICLSRVRDFKHRYVDVAGGGLLGIVLGFGMVDSPCVVQLPSSPLSHRLQPSLESSYI
uniref:AcidPPc domain-containing protein n=1 Tax=Heterorhabditis bacteriophora TaxID=37862 RepID=A0A1I7X3U5_HETBA